MNRSPQQLIDLAYSGLSQANYETDPSSQYALAHLAALRAAAAVVAAASTPGSAARRGRPRSVWELLSKASPELNEWARFFSLTAGKRTAAEAGIKGVVTAREAADLCRDVEVFVATVETSLGLHRRPWAC